MADIRKFFSAAKSKTESSNAKSADKSKEDKNKERVAPVKRGKTIVVDDSNDGKLFSVLEGRTACWNIHMQQMRNAL